MEKQKFGKTTRSQSNFEQTLQPKFAKQEFKMHDDTRIVKDE